jgi:hypothetical protein
VHLEICKQGEVLRVVHNPTFSQGYLWKVFSSFGILQAWTSVSTDLSLREQLMHAFLSLFVSLIRLETLDARRYLKALLLRQVMKQPRHASASRVVCG